MANLIEVEGLKMSIRGRWIRLGRLRNEFYEFIKDPDDYLTHLQKQRACDLFTFIQEVPNLAPRYPYPCDTQSLAVLPITTYENWWKKQVNDKTRNMVRKGPKSGLEIRPLQLNEEVVLGIARICNETPIRQGRRFKHFGKSPEQVRKEHESFLDRSEFWGAYYKEELVGYIKLVHGRGISNLMQILSLNAHRSKAPTNSLLAKAVERCAEMKVPLLQYGSWSRRSMGDFKKHHAFEQWDIPRYYVPLSAVGTLYLKLGMYRDWRERIPEDWIDRGAQLRGWLNALRN